MASAARSVSRVFARASPAAPSSSIRSSARSARFAVPAQAFRASGRRGYASGPDAKSSGGLIWGLGALALGGAGALYYLSADHLGVKTDANFVPTKADYQKVYDEIANLLIEKDEWDDGSYGPVLVRLAWHASGTYDKETKTGGSNGATMRFSPEADHGANAGLKHARDFLEPVKQKFPWITYSDLWTLAGACAIQEMQGPTIPWRPGRKDADASACTPDGRLPDASKVQDHVRAIFGRMGFDDREMVALIGAHAVGRAHPDRSGYDGPWTFSPTTFTNDFYKLLLDEKWSWRKWNGPDQYTDNKTKTLMMFPADMSLVKDKEFKKHVVRFAQDNDAFFKEFSEVFVKLMELGVPFTSKPEDRYVFKTSDSE